MADRDPGPLIAVPASYDVDVHAWTRAQAELLRSAQFGALDLPNIIEEIESLGNEQEHAIESFMVILAEHLVKLMVSSDREPRRAWRRSVVSSRNGIARRIRKSPSLRRMLSKMFDEAWPDARDEARGGLREAEEHLIPEALPFTVDQALDPSFFPGD